MRHHRVDRRAALRGIGAITIGLPLLEEMLVSSAVAGAAETVPPVRAFNLFFGLGIPAPLQLEGFEGVLEPLAPLRDKLLILRNVDQVRCDQSGINAHFDGASGAFTAEPPAGEAKAGGPSIDQVIRHACYPQGLPPRLVPTLVAGTFFRRSRVSRYVHSYNRDGTVAAMMHERPRDVFERVFGEIGLEVDSSLPPDERWRKARLKRSVLDAVVGQYRWLVGPRSPLGTASRTRVSDHLDRIREYERRAFQMKDHPTSGPEPPTESKLAHGGAADPGGQGIDMVLDDLTAEWRLMADLYAMAIELDRVRFGSLTFLAAGERLRIMGDYEFGDRLIYSFNDAKDLNASGDKGCSHEWWHKYRPEKENPQLRAHAHLKMREVAYFLTQLDRVREANGKSLLENSLITVSTESGDGRHNDVKRELSGVFHAITSADGRFKSGEVVDIGAEGLDVYNTMLEGMGVKERMGPDNRDVVSVDAIRA